jgi:hypothetical protein
MCFNLQKLISNSNPNPNFKKYFLIWKIINGGGHLITIASVNCLTEAGGLRHPPRLKV